VADVAAAFTQAVFIAGWRRIVAANLELPLPVSEWLTEALANSGVESLPVTCEIANRAATLSEIHRDPADRIIIATALVHDVKLASLDSVFPNYQELQNRLVGK